MGYKALLFLNILGKMQNYLQIIADGYVGYFHYLTQELLVPSWHNYFYALLLVSVLVWVLELAMPWRKHQLALRQDFWLDGFYMFFNFFLVSLIGFNALSNVGVQFFYDLMGFFGIKNVVVISVAGLNTGLRWLLMLVVADFLQWNIHRMLHRVPWLWRFHQLHHSTAQMGFSAHLRYHFIETLVYKTLQFVPLSLLGFGLMDFFSLHIFTIAIGHLNHANLNLNYGIFRYIFNNPKMHLWHHAKELPNEEKYRNGANFGLTLSLWDYVFGTAYTAEPPADLELGFEHSQSYPTNFWGQLVQPFGAKKGKN